MRTKLDEDKNGVKNVNSFEKCYELLRTSDTNYEDTIRLDFFIFCTR